MRWAGALPWGLTLLSFKGLRPHPDNTPALGLVVEVRHVGGGLLGREGRGVPAREKASGTDGYASEPEVKKPARRLLRVPWSLFRG